MKTSPSDEQARQAKYEQYAKRMRGSWSEREQDDVLREATEDFDCGRLSRAQFDRLLNQSRKMDEDE